MNSENRKTKAILITKSDPCFQAQKNAYTLFSILFMCLCDNR
jgi:hypothetical protein